MYNDNSIKGDKYKFLRKINVINHYFKDRKMFIKLVLYICLCINIHIITGAICMFNIIL